MKYITSTIKPAQRIMAIAACVTVLFASACKKDQTNPLGEDGVSTVIKDLQGDIGASVGGSVPGKENRPFRDFYYNFDKKLQITDTAANKTTLNWDIAFTGIYNSFVYINSGTNPKSPGFGGQGQGVIVGIDTPYDQVNEAPTAEAMEQDNLTFVGMDKYPQLSNMGWYFYTLTTHIAQPIKNRTFVLKTAAGKYAKLELISMYQGAPPTITDLNWPAPYFTFRYFVQQDGSRNLRTSK
ncbi:HmuY family protein [Mucilaginibacter conchicola]|nr:HmuY family protein [Mucilaginibacter conchicola]